MVDEYSDRRILLLLLHNTDEVLVRMSMVQHDGEVQVAIMELVLQVGHILSDHGDHVRDLVVQEMELSLEVFHVDIQLVLDQVTQLRVVPLQLVL